MLGELIRSHEELHGMFVMFGVQNLWFIGKTYIMQHVLYP